MNSFDKNTIVVEDLPKYFILGGVILLISVIFYLIWPFVPSLIIAAVIVSGFYPLYKKLLKLIKRPILASFILSLFLLAVIVTPISWFVSYITKEAFETYLYIEGKVDVLIKSDFTLLPKMIEDTFLAKYINQFNETINFDTSDLIKYGSDVVRTLSQFLVDKTANFAKQVSILVLHVFVVLISMFFFFRDGDRIVNGIRDLLPLPGKYKNVLLEKLHDISKGVLYGVFGAAMAQGFLGGVGFAIAGIENSAFWGTIMAFFSVVPYIGPTIIWIPAALTLIFTGHVFAGIFLGLWCTFIVGGIDNFIKPMLIGERAHIHPLLTFITIFGGIFTFGLSGLVIAPYILSLALTFLHIYQLEYKKILEE